MTWIQTFTGAKFDLANPREEDVEILDVAHALAHVCRYTGHTLCFYSVAQHSVVMSEQVGPGLAYWALMHDTPEAYTGDVSRPMKRLLGDPWRKVERRIEGVVLGAFGLSLPMPSEIKDADLRMLATERRDLLNPPPESWRNKKQLRPFDIEIEPWNPEWAERMFLDRYRVLAIDGSCDA
jgi:5'-deoxynucleotidase YfbR-like HD superfamily hydrolase